MSGLLFLLFNVGVVLVAHWCLRNDSASLDGTTNGIFAMAKPRQTLPPAPAAARDVKKVTLPTMRLPRLTRRQRRD
jgi:hypothetical protein